MKGLEVKYMKKLMKNSKQRPKLEINMKKERTQKIPENKKVKEKNKW